MNTQDVRLPSLKKISIKDYSLYPGARNFEYEFINGVNLIIGGNGVGKTTFLNILKYALIGLYKKELDVKRRELKGVEHRIEKRIALPLNYFSSRMDKAVDYNEQAEVTLIFKIGTKTFTITRGLDIPQIKSVKVREDGDQKALSGLKLSQKDYDDLFSQKNRDDHELKATLQWKYEDLVARTANLANFDSLIFFVNEVLFFSESRKTVMWDQEVQDRLSSKYFMDPKLDEKREDSEREGKYQNSLARHKGEDIRAIKKIFETIPEDDFNNREFKEIVKEREAKKREVAHLFAELEQIQSDRSATDAALSRIHSEKNNALKQLEDLEDNKRKEEERIFIDLFKKLTPKYNEYKSFLKSSGDCPLCNNNLAPNVFHRIANDESHCMMCGNDIRNTSISSPALTDSVNKITELQITIRNYEKRVIGLEDSLKKFDQQFRKATISLNESQTKLRQLEFAIQKDTVNETSKTDSEFKAMNARIEVLEREKKEAEEKSDEAYGLVAVYTNQIDQHRMETRDQLSSMFDKFGSKFLGVKCELIYEDPDKIGGNEKRYLPKIDGMQRSEEEALSESQRFFIDQSFRMSVLNLFSSSPSFFMCETPDSSLDVSYEKNAALVFLEYLKQPNELILTSNLNNSEFLEYLVVQAKKKIRYINLLKIGKQSRVQSGSRDLLKTSNKIERLINENWQ